MELMEIVLTGTTCGEMCWRAAENVCRCSCGGRNHGCLKTANVGQSGQPVRTRKLDGVPYKLTAIGVYHEMYAEADRLNRTALNNTHRVYNYERHLDSGDKGAFARVRVATESEVARWPELEAHIGKHSRPYLLWTRVD